jgi:hypothetical protein
MEINISCLLLMITPQGDEAKEQYKKDMVREKWIISQYSIKDHLIHHVSSLYSPKRMMETLISSI